MLQVEKARLQKMSLQWDKYLALAKDIVLEKNKRKLLKLLSDFEARDTEVCKYAQETICNQQELEGGCSGCPLEKWCGFNSFSTVMKVHSLVRLIRETPKPYSKDDLVKAVKLARRIVADEQSYKEFKECADKWQ